MNRYKDSCNPSSRIWNPYSNISDPFLPFTQLVFSYENLFLDLHNSFPRKAIRSFTLHNAFPPPFPHPPELCKSRKRIAILEKELCKSRKRITNPRERVAQSVKTIYFGFFANPHVPLELSKCLDNKLINCLNQ